MYIISLQGSDLGAEADRAPSTYSWAFCLSGMSIFGC